MVRTQGAEATRTSTTVERVAGWAATVGPGDVPVDVAALARAQRRSVLAACAASEGDPATARVLAAVAGWASPGPAPLLGTDGDVRVEDAVYGAAVRAMALDFDDYLLFGHPGHAAVLVPLLLSAETGTPGREQVVAQVVADEVGARLGGACLLGPLNGQEWSFVHAAGAALAAGRLLGLGPQGLAHALALALWQTPRPTTPGILGPDAKLTVAADPAVVGLRAARLAAAGATGPLDVLDAPRGFLGAFAHVALPAALDRLGEGWALRTLSVKPHPGCAYLTGAVEALCALGPPPAEEIAAVRVAAALPTCELAGLAHPGDDPGTVHPVTATFSASWLLAAVARAGAPGPEALRADVLADTETARLAGRVHVEHDWAASRRCARAILAVIPPRAVTAGVPAHQLAGAAHRLRRERPGLAAGPRAAVEALRVLWGSGRGRRVWDPQALAGFRMRLPTRVTLRLRDGTTRTAGVDVPAGAAGHASRPPEAVSRTKLAQHGTGLWSAECLDALDAAVDADADDLVARL